MQGRQVDTVFNALQYLVGNDGGFAKYLAAVHHAVPHGMDVAQAADFGQSGLIGRQPSEHVIERRRRVANGRRDFLARAVTRLNRDDGLTADPLHRAPA